MANACVDDIKNADNALKMRILLSIRLGKVKTALKHLTSKTDKMICEIMLGNV